MTADQARERIEALRVEIARHDELYFKKAAPVISDADYDRLKRELRALEAAWPEMVRRGEETGAVGDDRTGGFPVYQHRVRMLSLNKAYTEAELRQFDARLRRQLAGQKFSYVVEPKFDGLAISVTYEHGRLVRAVTRGNGTEGDDVTANVRAIRSVPESLRAASPESVEIRGEVYVGLSTFERLNRERGEAGEELYATPRNFAAGSLKLKETREVAERGLEVVFYGYGAWEPSAGRPESQQAWLAQLRAWGLPTVENPRQADSFAEMWAAVQAVGAERSTYAYPTDGAVVKVDATATQDLLGVGAQAPAWAIAYKFTPENAETRVRAITWQVGRSGVLSPVAELEPVVLGGSTVARATLHNREEIVRRDIRVGDFVVVEKAGEIVPAITGVNLSRRGPEVRPYEFPRACPACGEAVRTEASALRCANEACSAQVRRRIEYFASAAGVGIKGLGPALVEKAVASGQVRNVADLYRLRREDWLALPGVGEKTADALLAAVERSKRAELWRVINGLGIPQVGEAGARALARRFGSLEALARAQPQDFALNGRAQVEGIGESAGESVVTFLAQERNRDLIMALCAAGVRAE